MWIDVVSTPTELADALIEHRGSACAVIDVVRATTTLVVLGERQVARVLVAADVAAARALAQALPGTLLAGEIGGITPPGFDFGNTPAELLRADLAGRWVAFATTNGTRALRAAWIGQAHAIYAAALRNAGAVADLAFQQPAERDLLLVCAGRSSRLALDDLYAAGVIVGLIQQRATQMDAPIAFTESAVIARDLARTAGLPLDVLRRSEAGRAVIEIGLAADLACCAALNASAIVPRVAGVGPDDELIITYA
jgi:2-phosphosulfolactate phosphatase